VVGGSNTASYQANSNNVSSGTEAGMLFSAIGSPDPASFSPDSPPSSNLVTEEPQGVGYILDAVHDQIFGGNSASGDEIGIMLSGASDGNTIRNNSLTGDRLYGLLVVGQYQPEEVQSPAQYACSVICPTFSGDLSQSTGASSASNTFNDNTWTGNGTGAPLLNGANVLDGTGWGGGCASQVGSCAVGALTFDGSNTTFDSTSPGISTISIAVCNSSMETAVLPAGSQITFYSENQGDSGTFYLTADAHVPGRNCTSSPQTPYSLSVQALDPQLVGTDSSPSGQPYILDTGSTVTVNVNGATTEGLNSYATAAESNSCSPSYGFFGTSNGPSTLDSGSGGVNATYLAC